MPNDYDTAFAAYAEAGALSAAAIQAFSLAKARVAKLDDNDPAKADALAEARVAGDNAFAAEARAKAAQAACKVAHAALKSDN